MNDIRVVPTDDGRYKILINFVQEGIAYKDRILAEKELERIRGEKNENIRLSGKQRSNF